MAKLQKYFLNFHETIKLININENKTLREKRDIVLDKLRDRLKQIFEEQGKPVPSFDYLVVLYK